MENSNKKLLFLIREKGYTPADIASILGVNMGQIYRWNKKGINPNNPHYPKLKELLPELQPNETKIRKRDGKEDQRQENKRPKKELNLTETDLPSYEEPEFISKIHPNIYFKDKDGLPYVPIHKRDREFLETRQPVLDKIEYEEAYKYYMEMSDEDRHYHLANINKIQSQQYKKALIDVANKLDR